MLYVEVQVGPSFGKFLSQFVQRLQDSDSIIGWSLKRYEYVIVQPLCVFYSRNSWHEILAYLRRGSMTMSRSGGPNDKAE